MNCKCTCGGCDCPQIKVKYFPDYGAAAPVCNIVDWGLGNVAAVNPTIVNVRWDNAAGRPAINVLPWVFVP